MQFSFLQVRTLAGIVMATLGSSIDGGANESLGPQPARGTRPDVACLREHAARLVVSVSTIRDNALDGKALRRIGPWELSLSSALSRDMLEKLTPPGATVDHLERAAHSLARAMQKLVDGVSAADGTPEEVDSVLRSALGAGLCRPEAAATERAWAALNLTGRWVNVQSDHRVTVIHRPSNSDAQLYVYSHDAMLFPQLDRPWSHLALGYTRTHDEVVDVFLAGLQALGESSRHSVVLAL